MKSLSILLFALLLWPVQAAEVSPPWSIALETTPIIGGEQVATIPVRKSGADWYPIYCLEVFDIVPGEMWMVFAEAHATNDDLRDRGKGLAWVTQLRWGADCDGVSDGDGIDRANGTFNLGPEAHHGFVTRVGSYVWTEPQVSVWVKLMTHAKSTAAISGDDLKIDQNRGRLWVLRIKP